MIKEYIYGVLVRLPVFKEVFRRGSIDSFHKAHADIMETMKDDLEKRADQLSDEKLSKMMSPVDWRHVVSHDERRGVVMIGGERALPETLAVLKSEAEMLFSMELWRLLQETPNALAQQTMFKTGVDTDSFVKGRSMIYHLDSQRKIVELLKSYSPPKPIDTPP